MRAAVVLGCRIVIAVCAQIIDACTPRPTMDDPLREWWNAPAAPTFAEWADTLLTDNPEENP